MSDAMNAVEIEDVLSSIRRLVSEDLRPAAHVVPVPKPAPQPEAAPASGKLLLTPALRVVSNTPVEVAPDPVPDAPEAPFDAGDMAESDGPFGEASDVPRVVSEIGAAVADQAGEWEPEVGDASVGLANWQVPDWVEEAEVVADSVEAAERDAVARALADKAEAAAVAEIMAQAMKAKTQDEEAAPRAEAQPSLSEDEIVDEAMLRDLVRSLIREELNGALGERITRNVRKLVRSEINRAMAAREFE